MLIYDCVALYLKNTSHKSLDFAFSLFFLLLPILYIIYFIPYIWLTASYVSLLFSTWFKVSGYHFANYW